MLDRYIGLPYNYQSEIGYDTLIQNVILKDLINLMGTTITDLDIELKMKVGRIEYLESKYIQTDHPLITLRFRRAASNADEILTVKAKKL